MELISYITQQTNLSKQSIENTISLFNEDCTIPFISRYRKEKTGNLDEVEIGEILKYKDTFEALEKRKKAILKALEEQHSLTQELSEKIENAEDIISVEDLYLPFKKKRKTKAETARLQGLEPLAKMIMSQRINDLNATAKKFVTKDVENIEIALEGARFIIAEWINERTDIRNMLRQQIVRFAIISSKVIPVKAEDKKALKFKDYFDWNESLNTIPSHRFLAIVRAENEGYIRIKIAIDEEIAIQKITRVVFRSQNECTSHIQSAIEDAFKRLLFPSLSNEALSLAKEKADNEAIAVFSKNLKQLLLGAPLGEKKVLAIDPGFRSGCKIVCLNAQGDLEHNETIFPHEPQKKMLEAIKKISFLVDAHKIEAIAIGNGTASRETEDFIKKIQFKNSVAVFVVNEAGASIYSASKIARDEFPTYDVTVRGAISIGRRLQDPLAELVKIDAKSIGVGQYQHDVDQVKLKKSLDTVVESCVNTVGITINTASESLLSYVSGIGPKLAENIVKYRNENGAFSSRNAIKKVPKLGAKAFEQAAGFLRIKNPKNPLDDSAVHPENYDLIDKMAKELNIKVADFIGNKTLIQKIPLQNYTSLSIGLPTLQDIMKELEKPGVDPREKATVFSFDATIKTIDDLRIGQILPGIVNNITNFGCFVNIGIKESGLIHVSNLSDTFVKDVNAIVSLQQQVFVKVLEVDAVRKRIQLALVK
ncbi:RNA-binding transcriptional accessory protein [Polaribacter sp. BAL334]|uniref:Tex family protein n=1 Tax=Polaribacter sp. BAL334 TaxID=1708178 RepID=UPI0018D25CA6|nr:Tex family protein [Polaribacter sp. BAL334]MBG7612413.1 RNA-binding transcriptional accessory protein [Polaribacter sp. BAL334]